MKRFLRETWPYVLLPFVVLAIAIAVFLIGFGDATAPFSYNVY